MGKDAKRSGTNGKASKTEITLEDHALVIVFDGLKPMASGPYIGQMTISPSRIYLQGELLGFISKIEFSHEATQPLPEIRVSFLSGYDPEKLQAPLAEALGTFLLKLKQALPWAKWETPLGTSEAPSPMAVFDPGHIKPK